MSWCVVCLMRCVFNTSKYMPAVVAANDFPACRKRKHHVGRRYVPKELNLKLTAALPLDVSGWRHLEGTDLPTMPDFYVPNQARFELPIEG